MLDRRGQNALDPNPVTAHDRRNLLAIPVAHARAHRFRILVAQLEDVSNLDRGIDAQGCTAIRAVFARRHAADVGGNGVLEIPPRRHVLQVIVELVGAADHVDATNQSLIEYDGDRPRIAALLLHIPPGERFLGLYHQANRPNEAAGALKAEFHFLGLHGTNLARLYQGEQLGFVHGVIAAQESHDRLLHHLAVVTGLLCHVGHGLDVLLGGNLQELRHIGDRAFARRMDQQRLAIALGLQVLDRSEL